MILFYFGPILLLSLMILAPRSLLGQIFNKDYSDLVKLENGIQLTKKDGLPSHSIRSFAEGPDGFIWIGTGDGLCKFDGTQFKIFRDDPLDSTSLYDGRISPLLADSQYLYIGTHLGFSIMDFKTEKFRNFQMEHFKIRDNLSKKVITRVSSLEKTSDGDIWVGTFTDGIFRYTPETDSFRSYHYPREKIAPYFPIPRAIDHVLSIKQDRFNDSIIWAGTTAGLLKINAISHKMTSFIYPKVEEHSYISQNAIRYIYQHHDGQLYLSSWNAKVNIFDPSSSKFYPLPIENKTKAKRDEGYKMIDAPVADIIPKSDHELWIKTSVGSMTYDTQKKIWTELRWNQVKKEKIYGVTFIDSQNRTWLRGIGVHLFDPVQQQFVQYDYEDYNTNLFGFSYHFLRPQNEFDCVVLPHSGDGIFLLNSKSRHWKKTQVPIEFRSINEAFTPRDFGYSSSGFYTITSKTGVFNYYPKSQTFELLSLPSDYQKKSFPSVLWDEQGRLWLGANSNEGLLRWTVSQNKWEVIKTELEVNNSNVNLGAITYLTEDSHKNIWFRRGNGFSVYVARQDTFYNFLGKVSSEKPILNPRGFVEDQKGRIWVRDLNGILAYTESAHPEKGIIKKYDLLASHKIRDISFLKVDEKGILWWIANESLCQFNPNTEELTKHSLWYGVTEDNIYGFDILPDGRFVLGGKNKIWIAKPEDLLINPEKPIPYLTEIAVLQEPFKSDIPPHLQTSLNLDYTENFFSFDFSSIGFTRGNENKFRYRLKGFDDKWTETKTRRFANFTNVSAGDYIFELQAANNEGIWNEKQTEVAVHIGTPWWQAIWFWAFSIFTLLGLAYLIYNWRIGQVRKEERLRSDYERKLTEMEMSALRAQMNPHFIFNSLNSIEYFIISNEPEKASDYLNRFSRLIRLILQNSKSSIVPLKDDLKALKLYIEIESMRFDNLFDYEVRIETDIDSEKVYVPPMVLQPYIENAIWHGLLQKKEGRGKIDLTIRQHHDTLICTIEDNGIGRAAAQQLKSKTATKGKSFGMKITSDRLDALNQLANTKAAVQIFDLKDDADEACGTRVELVIPL